jgi:hypothetical protein
MKHAFAICFILLLVFSVQAQKHDANNYLFAGVNARLPAGALDFGEIFLGKLKKDGFSWQLKVGAGSQLDQQSSQLNMGGYKNGELQIEYSPQGVYIKAGWIPGKVMGKHYTMYFSINDNITFTRHRLTLTTEDKVYGNETHLYEKYLLLPLSAIEIENVHMIHVSPRFTMHFSYYVGACIQQADPFVNDIRGINSFAHFVPGVTFGGAIYVNGQVGFSFKLLPPEEEVRGE